MPDDAGFSAELLAKQPPPQPPNPSLLAPTILRPIWIEEGDWEERSIIERAWIAPGYLLRGHITSVIGPPGVSKSTLMIAYAVALVLEKALHGLRPTQACRVMLYNVEDDREEEQQRRMSATLTTHGKKPSDIAGKIARVGPSGIGILLLRDPEINELQPTTAMAELEKEIERWRPDVLILDPLSELHSEEENANVAMREVMAEFRKLARRHTLALVLVHHTRKGLVIPGDMDGGRGASSIAGASRIVLTIAGMTEKEAKAFGLPPNSRKHFLRVDGAKSNYAPLTDANGSSDASMNLRTGTRWQSPRLGRRQIKR